MSENTNRYEAIEKQIENGDLIINFISNGKKRKIKVVGFNLSIGATFVLAENPNKYIFCSHGKLSPRMRGKSIKGYEKYTQYMDLIAIEIQNGTVNWDNIEQIVFGFPDPFGSAPSSKTCAYNQ